MSRPSRRAARVPLNKFSLSFFSPRTLLRASPCVPRTYGHDHSSRRRRRRRRWRQWDFKKKVTSPRPSGGANTAVPASDSIRAATTRVIYIYIRALGKDDEANRAVVSTRCAAISRLRMYFRFDNSILGWTRDPTHASEKNNSRRPSRFVDASSKRAFGRLERERERDARGWQAK